MTRTIVDNVMFNHHSPSDPQLTERDIFTNKFFRLAYSAAIETIGNSVSVFYKNNPELVEEFKAIYPRTVYGPERLAMTIKMVMNVLGENDEMIKFIDDDGLFRLSNYCMNVLYPEARIRIEGGVLRKNARARGYICPYCKKPLDMSLDGVENAHAIPQDGVGNRLDSVSLFAAHRECNEVASLRSTLAHYEVLGFI